MDIDTCHNNGLFLAREPDSRNARLLVVIFSRAKHYFPLVC